MSAIDEMGAKCKMTKMNDGYIRIEDFCLKMSVRTCQAEGIPCWYIQAGGEVILLSVELHLG